MRKTAYQKAFGDAYEFAMEKLSETEPFRYGNRTVNLERMSRLGAEEQRQYRHAFPGESGTTEGVLSQWSARGLDGEHLTPSYLKEHRPDQYAASMRVRGDRNTTKWKTAKYRKNLANFQPTP